MTRYLSFDAANRVHRQIYSDGISGREFGYDGLGRLVADLQIAYEGGSDPCTGAEMIYENGNSCVEPAMWNTVGGATFSYDAVGNRTDQGGDYGAGNRVRQFASCTYVTDSLGDGNVLSRTCGSEVVRFHWTAESRLKALKVVGGDSLDFRYDASGRLVRRDVNGAAQSQFLWQGDNLLAELNGTANGKIAEYSYYPGLDNPHAVITGTTPHFAHVDGIDNVIGLTDAAENVKRDYVWDSWGQLTGGTDSKPFSNADRARFKGALWLGPQVDLYYMRARWYEPKSGRFLSEDPIGLAGGLNPYSYAANDPVNRRDPTGLLTCRDGVTIIIDDQPVGCTQELLDMVDDWFTEHQGMSLDQAWAIGGYNAYYSGGRRETICPAAFRSQGQPSALCETLSGALAYLLSWGDNDCFTYGLRGARRFRRGQFDRFTGYYYYRGDRKVAYSAGDGPTGVIHVSSQAFTGRTNLPNLLAHEEFHLQMPGVLNTPMEEFWAGQEGDRCGRGPRNLW